MAKKSIGDSHDKWRSALIKNTVEQILKQDPILRNRSSFQFETGYTILAKERGIFYGPEMSKLIVELALRRFPEERYGNCKFIFFSTSVNKKIKDLGEWKSINFHSTRFKEPKTKLNVEEIKQLHPEYGDLLIRDLMRSIHYKENTTDEISLSTFDDIWEQVSSLNDVKELISNLQSELEKTGKKRNKNYWSNFKHVCGKDDLNNYFSKNSDLSSILENNKKIIIHIDNIDFDSVYRNVLSLLLYYVVQYCKNKKTKTIVIFDNIFSFISMQHMGNSERLSDIFERAFECLHSSSPYDKKDSEKFTPLTIFPLFNEEVGHISHEEDEQGEIVGKLISINQKIVIEIDGYLFYLLQKYGNIDLGFLAGILKMSDQRREFWEENKKVVPFLIGYPENFRISNEINLDIAPIDFSKYELNLELLMKMIKYETDTIEFKECYSLAKKKILVNIIQFLRHRGGNIILGVTKQKMPIGLNREKEKVKEFDEIIETIFQSVSSNIFPSIRDNIKVHHFQVQRKDFITITIWADENNRQFTNNKGEKWDNGRFGTVGIHY